MDMATCRLSVSGKLAKIHEALALTRETSMEIYGEMCEVLADVRAPFNRELRAGLFKIDSQAIESSWRRRCRHY
jgi:asparaginyl-tRNA synthetase